MKKGTTKGSLILEEKRQGSGVQTELHLHRHCHLLGMDNLTFNEDNTISMRLENESSPKQNLWQNAWYHQALKHSRNY